MNRRKKREGGLSLGGIIALIILIKLLNNLGGVITLMFGAALLVLAFFLIRAIIAAVKDSGGEKRNPVDVSTQGSYPKAAQQSHKTSESAYAAPPVQTAPKPRPAPAAKQEPVYAPEVQAVVDEGKKAHTELEHLYATIPNLSVKGKIRELIDVSDKIVQDAADDPSDVPQIKKFLDYYLPTTIKLLNAYDRMGAQGIEGNNISSSMHSIEEMLDTAVAAYKKLLDSLFANQALDVETDIQVMNTLLKREGFSGSGFPGVAASGSAVAVNNDEIKEDT